MEVVEVEGHVSIVVTTVPSVVDMEVVPETMMRGKVDLPPCEGVVVIVVDAADAVDVVDEDAVGVEAKMKMEASHMLEERLMSPREILHPQHLPPLSLHQPHQQEMARPLYRQATGSKQPT